MFGRVLTRPLIEAPTVSEVQGACPGRFGRVLTRPLIEAWAVTMISSAATSRLAEC